MQRDWWQLPGPAQFLSRVADDLREGRNLVLCLPKHLPGGLEEAVRAALEQTGSVEWLGLRVEAEKPARQLFDRFVPHAAAGALHDVYALVQEDAFAGKVIWLRGLESTTWPIWKTFLVDYGHACRTRTNLDRTLFVVPLVGELAPDPPPEELCVAVHRWRGVVDSLDMLLYVARLLQPVCLPPLHKRLAAAVVARLALWDPLTGEALSAQPLETILEPAEVLRKVARGRGWEAGQSANGEGWQSGLTDLVAGREQVHSAVLALHDPEREIPRRLWSAQVGVLLPFVEERRQEYLRELRHLLRVPFTSASGAVIDDLLDLEIGHIEWQLGERGREVPAEVRTLRRIRNCLAHLEPLSLDLLRSDILSRCGPV